MKEVTTAVDDYTRTGVRCYDLMTRAPKELNLFVCLFLRRKKGPGSSNKLDIY